MSNDDFLILFVICNSVLFFVITSNIRKCDLCLLPERWSCRRMDSESTSYIFSLLWAAALVAIYRSCMAGAYSTTDLPASSVPQIYRYLSYAYVCGGMLLLSLLRFTARCALHSKNGSFLKWLHSISWWNPPFFWISFLVNCFIKFATSIFNWLSQQLLFN